MRADQCPVLVLDAGELHPCVPAPLLAPARITACQWQERKEAACLAWPWDWSHVVSIARDLAIPLSSRSENSESLFNTESRATKLLSPSRRGCKPFIMRRFFYLIGPIHLARAGILYSTLPAPTDPALLLRQASTSQIPTTIGYLAIGALDGSTACKFHVLDFVVWDDSTITNRGYLNLFYGGRLPNNSRKPLARMPLLDHIHLGR